jgi:hypothetical protein
MINSVRQRSEKAAAKAELRLADGTRRERAGRPELM